MGLRDDILAAEDRLRLPVPTPEWPAADGKLYVRTISALERERFSEAYRGNGDGRVRNVMARFCVLCLCDGDGRAVFTEADAEELGRKAGHVVDRIFSAAQKLNGIGAAAAEEALKNSASGPGAASS